MSITKDPLVLPGVLEDVLTAYPGSIVKDARRIFPALNTKHKIDLALLTRIPCG